MLGHLEESVLIAVLKLEKAGQSAFGLAVFNKLKAAGINIVNGLVYNTLARLEAKGLLHLEITNPVAQKRGRRKRIYLLETKALDKLQESYLQKQSTISKLETALANVSSK